MSQPRFNAYSNLFNVMKTQTNLTVSLIAALALGFGGEAFAVHNPTHTQQRDKEEMTRNSRRSGDRNENTAWNTVSYPFRMIGRAGNTVLRTPQIISETVAGDRKFISRRGLLAAPENREEVSTASQEARSVPMGRGQRHPVFAPRE